MQDKINVAVIGLGRIGNLYDQDEDLKFTKTHVGAYLKNSYVNLAGVSDVSQGKIELFKKMRGDFPVYCDYRKLLRNNRVDFLSICTHEELHIEIIEEAIKAGVKGIFCEKPLCLSLEEAYKIRDIISDNGVYFSINISRRWDNAFNKLKDYISIGTLGYIQGVNGTYAKGIYNTGSHLLDMLNMLLGDIKEIRASKNRIAFEEGPTPDLQVIFNEFTAFISGLDINNYQNFDIRIYGSTGAVEIINGGSQIKLYKIGNMNEFTGLKKLVEENHNFGNTLSNLMQNAIDDNIQRYIHGEKPLCGIEEGIKTMMNIDEVKRQWEKFL